VPRRLGGKISAKEILHFGKFGLGFLDILFSDFLLRKDNHTCGTTVCTVRTVCVSDANSPYG
jgi:hypothetical protein